MKFAFLAIAISCTGIGIFIGSQFLPKNNQADSPQPRTNKIDSDLINPIYGFDLEIEKPDPKIGLLEQDLKTLLNEKDNHAEHKEVGIFFRELNFGGASIGIHSDLTFSPASLFKVPLMMAYFKQTEKNPDFLQTKILYENKMGLNQHEFYTAREYIEVGKEYSIEKLIEYMIIHSDNEATYLLKDYLDPEISNQTYLDLGINVPQNQPEAEFMTVRAYSSFFRILYNSTYLNEELSAKALEILTKSDFKLALREPIPGDIRVAHKFGERASIESNLKQLHDCGIIYFPGHPYSLCIMTKGDDFDKQAKQISQISQTVYERIKTIYAQNEINSSNHLVFE